MRKIIYRRMKGETIIDLVRHHLSHEIIDRTSYFWTKYNKKKLGFLRSCFVIDQNSAIFRMHLSKILSDFAWNLRRFQIKSIIFAVDRISFSLELYFTATRQHPDVDKRCKRIDDGTTKQMWEMFRWRASGERVRTRNYVPHSTIKQ